MLLLIAIAAGVSVANLYYNQPLLAQISESLHISSAAAGYVSTCTQIGYAAGLLLFVPLGDIRERRGLMTILLALVTLSLLAVAIAQNVIWLYMASFAVGITTVVPQILIPLAAQLASPERRGKVIGTVMSGLLFGILLARTVSGLIGGAWGWRTMYIVAAAMMLVLLIVLRSLLPVVPPVMNATYGQLLVSIATLTRKYVTLRESALLGALNFACFSLFWTSLTFFLEGAPYHYTSQTAGLFGLIGAAGALAAPAVGRLSDRIQPKWIIGSMVALILLSFVLFGWTGHTLIGLVIGTILLDLGVQGSQISNQARIYALEPAARSRLNTVFMVGTFLGGALGSSVGSYMWHIGGWAAVCVAGAVLSALSFTLWGLFRWRERVNGQRSAPVRMDRDAG